MKTTFELHDPTFDPIQLARNFDGRVYSGEPALFPCFRISTVKTGSVVFSGNAAKDGSEVMKWFTKTGKWLVTFAIQWDAQSTKCDLEFSWDGKTLTPSLK